MAVRVEYVKRKHIEGLHALADIIARERKYSVNAKAPELDRFRETVLQYIAADAPYYVATETNNVVGFCRIYVPTYSPYTHVGTLVMGVSPKRRGMGIGTRLLRRATEHGFDKCKLLKIELDVFVSNTPAIGLYTSYGFVVEGIKRKAVKLGRSYIDMIEMALFGSEL